jgi:predicted dehydrogenase
VGIIGCGVRSAWIASCLAGADAEIKVAVVADPEIASAKKRLDDAKVDRESARFVPSCDALLAHADDLDGLIIGTRCNLHAPIAIQVARAGLPIFLEKPVAISAEQVDALHDAYLGREESVVVSFPLRLTPLFQRVVQIIRSGRLGTINQVQATNYVPYGGVYFGQWYRDYDINGGLWLQKATHDFDCINQLVRSDPTAIVATSTRKIYGGEMPDDLTCAACTVRRDCPESPESIAARDDDGGMGRGDHACAFSVSIRHHDAGSAMIAYADGTHAAYSQNFIPRRSAAQRGARVTGYLATLAFDWYTDTIQVIEHHGRRVENIRVQVTEPHHGGDAALARNFVAVMRKRDVSRASLHDGLLSASMCLAARASEASRRFEPVIPPARRDERRLQHADGDPPPRVHVTVQRPGGPQRSAGPRRAPGARR